LAIAAIDQAWSNAFENSIIEDADELHKQGWKDLYKISDETGRGVNTLSSFMRTKVESKKFECKKVRIFHSGKVIFRNFYRPIVKS
jgi:hypothetical protein